MIRGDPYGEVALFIGAAAVIASGIEPAVLYVAAVALAHGLDLGFSLVKVRGLQGKVCPVDQLHVGLVRLLRSEDPCVASRCRIFSLGVFKALFIEPAVIGCRHLRLCHGVFIDIVAAVRACAAGGCHGRRSRGRCALIYRKRAVIRGFGSAAHQASAEDAGAEHADRKSRCYAAGPLKRLFLRLSYAYVFSIRTRMGLVCGYLAVGQLPCRLSARISSRSRFLYEVLVYTGHRPYNFLFVHTVIPSFESIFLSCSLLLKRLVFTLLSPKPSFSAISRTESRYQ